MDLIFVTFDVDVTQEVIENVLLISPSFSRSPTKEIINALFHSARIYHPKCRFVVLTDQTTQFPNIPEAIEIVRYDLDVQNLTMSRTEAQFEFLKHSKGKSNIIFLDTDMLVQGCLLPLFSEPFDVGVTYRKHHTMPINGGLILIRAEGFLSACYFMHHVLSLIQNKYKNFQVWGGSQFALVELVGKPTSLVDETVIVKTAFGTRVLLLPCSKYNFTEPDSKVDMNGYYPEKFILHFKGRRKTSLIPYYEKHIASKL